MGPELSRITTEAFNTETRDIDNLSTIDMVTAINNQDKQVALAVERCLPEIARAVDAIFMRLKEGGRLFYIGAGTSGRLGVLDASELLPTFSFPQEWAVGIIAGGMDALIHPAEGAEDHYDMGEKDLSDRGFNSRDILIGIAASGRTPYVIGALDYAKRIGAGSISLACSKDAEVSKHADIAIEAVTGAETISGSTRMKAGTAQKMVLNMLSTGAMIKLGKVYSNLMVDLMATNEKLKSRAVRIVAEAAGCDAGAAEKALKEAEGSAKLAILILMSGGDPRECQKALSECGGYLRNAIALMAGEQ